MFGLVGITALLLSGLARIVVPASAGQNSPGSDTAIRPFKIDITNAALRDLHERLNLARFPDQLTGAGWTYGTELGYLKQLIAYWRDHYDWRAEERRLNTMPQFKTRIEGLDIHFVHRRSPEANAIPLLMIHGWPSTFDEYSKVIEPLADPRRHGGDPKDAFHVVVVSLPGFGFSDKPTSMGHGRERTARILIELMQRLGYTRYGVQAGDLGGSVAFPMALDDPTHMAGLHLDRCAGEAPDTRNPDAGLTAEETRLKNIPKFGPDETGYQAIQGSRPQTLGYALNDSPVGLAAWIVEKFRAWCDCNGDPESVFTKDQLLTTITIYWLTQTATSSTRYYYEGRHLPELPFAPPRGRVMVPTACTAFAGDPQPFVPRSWAATYYNVQRFTMLPKGGHFPALEQPAALIDDVRAFFAGLR